MASNITEAFLSHCMDNLAKTGKIFQNEAQFQFDLAWEIQKKLGEGYRIHLEKMNLSSNSNKKNYTDIVVQCPQGELVAIELKYKTKVLSCKKGVTLSTQSADDNARYDYYNDISRNEKLKAEEGYAKGFAIFLTNSSSYWNCPQGKNEGSVMYREFSIRENSGSVKIAKGAHQWLPVTNSVTKSGRKDPIHLGQDYVGAWKDYSVCGACSACKRVEFRYLILES